MPGLRFVLLGAAVVLLLLALVVGSAFQALGGSFRQLNQARDRTRDGRKAAAPRRLTPARYTPERTRLRWYSPEIVAVLLLSLAAGLWLARLVA